MIKEFLRGKTVFLTGATGFLGQPLLEKILWSAPDVHRIYILIRPKHQFGGRVLSADDRLQREIFQSTVFDRLQMRHQDDFNDFLRRRITAVAGDISKEGLGIDPAEAEKLRREVDVVINSAAVVSFDAPLDEALDLNVFGARRVADFARQCEGAILIHVSTAYVCGAATGDVPETLHAAAPGDRADGSRFPDRAFSDPDCDIEEINRIIEAVRSASNERAARRELLKSFIQRTRKGKNRRRYRRSREIEILRQKWISGRLAEEGMRWARQRGWNDTYTYTKALGEQLVARTRGEMPTTIVRPSIIESSLSEPNPGWLDGLRMADPLIVAIGKGRLRALPLNPDVGLDLVPADMVVNAILAVIPKTAEAETLQVLQVATGAKNPLTLGELNDLIYHYFRGNPMLDREGRPISIKRLRFPSPTAFRLQHRLKSVPLGTAERTLERLPAFGAAQRARRRVSATRVAHQKLFYYGALYEPYLNLNCRFAVDRTMALYESLSEREKREFNFDVSSLNWRHYIQNVHIPGVKKYILKIEGTGTLELSEYDALAPGFPSTVRDLLDASADRLPDQIALQMRRHNKWVRYSLGDLRRLADETASRFLQLELRKGDRVILLSENQPEWGIAYMAAATIGLVVVPLDSQTWHREVWSVAAYTEAKAMLASERCFERLPAEGLLENERAGEPALILNVNQLCKPFNAPNLPRSTGRSLPDPASPPVFPKVEADDEASIIFTTGTAVDPKGVVHTHRSFLNNLRGVNHYLSVSESDRLLSVLPLYHALEFSCGFLMAIHRCATVTYVQSLKPRVILETMRETGTTCLLGVPTLYSLIREDIERRILKASKSTLKNNLLKTSRQLSRSVEETFGRNIGRKLFARVYEELGGHMRVLVSGGSALGRGLYRDFRAMGLTIYEGYGLTETAPVLTVNPLHRSREGSAGKPLPGVEMRVYRPDKDGIGEIIVRTPSIMKEYYRNPEATRAAFQEGWFHTGDLGWVDADGYLYITGRIKDVIVTGAGKNVYPADLEAIYETLPGIRELGVVGVRSGLTEDVHAVIVPSGEIPPGTDPVEAKKIIQRELQELAKELPSYQRLQAIHIWSEPLPRDEAGRLDRRALREWVHARVSGEDKAPPRPERESSRRETLYSELSRFSGLEVGEITEESNLYTDLGLDSLMAVELLLFMERSLGVTVSDERASGFQTVGDILDELRRRGLGPTPDGVPAASRTYRSALPLGERPALDRALMGASFSGLKQLFKGYFRLRVTGSEELPRGEAHIIAANHSSHLDSAAVIAAISLALGVRRARRVHVIGARDYFFDSPFKSWLFSTCLNVVPIERDEIGLSGLRMVGSILTAGEPVLIFPEGTRSRTGRLQEFKPGVGLLAWEYQVPVIPAYIDGAFTAMPPGRSWPRRRGIEVRFGRPVAMAEYAEAAGSITRDELYRRIAGDLRRAVTELAGGPVAPAREAVARPGSGESRSPS